MNEAIKHILAQAPEADTPFSRVMKTWAHWMRLDDHKISTGDAHPQDVKELMACGEAVDVMVDDLPRIQWWAVRKAYSISTVWRFPEHAYADALSAAEATLSEKMQRNVATRRYFN